MKQFADEEHQTSKTVFSEITFGTITIIYKHLNQVLQRAIISRQIMSHIIVACNLSLLAVCGMCSSEMSSQTKCFYKLDCGCARKILKLCARAWERAIPTGKRRDVMKPHTKKRL